MGNINSEKFCKLTNEELSNIHGGGLWGQWKQVGDVKSYIEVCNGIEVERTSYVEQYSNWFGLHKTDQLRSVDD